MNPKGKWQNLEVQFFTKKKKKSSTIEEFLHQTEIKYQDSSKVQEYGNRIRNGKLMWVINKHKPLSIWKITNFFFKTMNTIIIQYNKYNVKIKQNRNVRYK